MDDLATEILLRIFAFACTDGGYTGCSLSLVSKHTQRVSRSLRFHSVSLTSSPTKLSKLLCLLAKECSGTLHYTPRIRHLYLECMYRGELRDTVLQSRRTHGSTETVLQHHMENVSRLLHFAYPYVETLTLVSDNVTECCIALPCPFPSLQELTGVRWRFQFDFPPHELGFLSLRRLHLVSPPGTVDLSCWAVHAPQVTHLRVSGANGDGPLVKSILQIANETGDGRQFPCLVHILLQPPPAPRPGGICGTRSMLHFSSLIDLCRAHAKIRLPTYLIPADDMLQPVDFHDNLQEALRVKTQWMARMAGGEGCWAVKKEWSHRQEGIMPPSYMVPWMTERDRAYHAKIFEISSMFTGQ